MKKEVTNYAFIDSQNVYMAIRALGWKLDHRRFRVYLREKYNVEKAFLFIGYLEGNTDLYENLEKAGFSCIFKPTLTHGDGVVKGNCDAELVLQAMIEYKSYDKAVIVSGDGDFSCLVKYLIEQEKLETVLIPNQFMYSSLLRKFGGKKLNFMNDLRGMLEYKMKRTPEGQNPKGDFSS